MMSKRFVFVFVVVLALVPWLRCSFSRVRAKHQPFVQVIPSAAPRSTPALLSKSVWAPP